MRADTVLVANRGAIATRIIRTLRRMGLRSVAVYSEADAESLHVLQADEAYCIGPAPAAESYLDAGRIIAVAREAGAGLVHPGYGFLAENADFAEKCAEAGIAFIGPTPENIRTFGLKHTARDLAEASGVPLAPGTGLLSNADEAVAAARDIGFPVILKATAGGGGIGMRVCENEADIHDAFASVARLGSSNFGDGGVFLERYIARARHIEVQIFGDGAGRVMPLGERDCSLQRRNQKVVEEAPAPLLDDATRSRLTEAAARLAQAAKYRSAGTVEFLFDAERGDFFFLEMNTRLQVEHGVTEEVMGIDLVEWMIRGAKGDFAMLDSVPPEPRGHAVQVRLYAEDPALDYRPTSGILTEIRFPEGVRADTWCAPGSTVSAWYDPMIAKLITHAPTRGEAIAAMQAALGETRLDGIETNLRWLRDVVRDPDFSAGTVSTRMLGRIEHRTASVTIVSGGTATSVQDWPGREGYWAVGVPPSGPMDDLSFRLGNRRLGNPEGTAGLEVTFNGPTLRFSSAARICLAGADFAATLDGEAVPRDEPIDVSPGQTLALGRVRGAGVRGYILFAGGLDLPAYLGSRATFALGQFGGHAARTLVAGDTLHLAGAETGEPERLPAMPEFDDGKWTLRVMYGPHGAPDFFTESDIAEILGAEWKVHYNSNRTGVRLVGPKPEWARGDGGEAGLHPSNIHDNPYAIGALDFTGDMPIILGPDGPSLGGFVCPFVVIAADRWKIGQLAPGDCIRFVPVAFEQAQEIAAEQRLGKVEPPALGPARHDVDGLDPILAEIPGSGNRPNTVYRQQGDRNILVEYGPIVLDLELRIRVHALLTRLEAMDLAGVIDMVPGIRSLQLHFDGTRLDQKGALAALIEAEQELGDLEDFTIPSRILHLPLSWRDPATIETIEKYMAAVRDDAPWCPDNIEFIRRVNGLCDTDAVKDIVFDASYLVMGLGDVYLGAPVATPVDPRHRLVTTKYNPARTWTPPNVVGIGGAYMCIYGMEGPGGYQLFGRTIQVWNTYRQTDAFREDKPWLLRFFDQIRFFEVSAEELAEWRRDFPTGRRSIEIEHSEFSLAKHRDFLAANAESIRAFEQRRGAAFAAERTQWERDGEFDRISELVEEEAGASAQPPEIDLPEGTELIEAPFGGSVWKLLVKEGEKIEAGATIAVIEAMKMESPLESPGSGTVEAVYIAERQALEPGAPILALRKHA